MCAPHPELIPLLEKYVLSYHDFMKPGRVLEEIGIKRRQIVTDLHNSGKTWAEMVLITGKSNGAIQRLSEAKGNPTVKDRQKSIGQNIGSAWKGRSRHEQLKKMWEDGTFDHLRGRKRTETEKQKLVEAHQSPELKCRMSEIRKALWADPHYRQKMAEVHSCPEYRARLSELQTHRMLEHPGRYFPKRIPVVGQKSDEKNLLVHSSYEVRAVEILDNDSGVVSYQYEKTIRDGSGRWMFPDFIVRYRDNTTCLVEIKSNWVLGLPENHKVSQRLRRAEAYARSQGWSFQVWVEENLFNDQ